MCSYADRPYTTGTKDYNVFLQTPIRDKVVCPSGPAEPYVIPIAGGSAYLDLSALSLQLIVLVVLIVGSPILYARKVRSKKFVVGSLSIGVLYGLFLLLATINHVGKGLVLGVIAVSTLALLVIGLSILKMTKK